MKRIIIIVLAVLIVITGVFTYINGKKQAEQNREMEEVSNLLLQYNAEKKSIERDIEKAWEEYDKVLAGGDCCFTLFVDDITHNLMNNAYPTIMDYGYEATVVMSDLQIPTDDGCITKNDYDKLTEAGWDFAIGTGELDLTGEDSVEVLESYIKDYREKLTEAGFDIPKTFCFNQGQYDEKYNDVLLDNGFEVIRHEEVLRDKYSHGVERNGLYLLSTGIVRSNTTAGLKKDMTTVFDNKYTYGVTVRYITRTNMEEDMNIDSSIPKYQAMLEYISGSCIGAKVFTATELYEYKTGAVADSEDYYDRFSENMAKMENDLAAVDAEIAKLKESIYK